MATPVPLWLDHASIVVPDLRVAVAHLEVGLGLTATVSPDAPERHSRIYLDRTYLEVSADADHPGWETTTCFLRFADPEALRAHLAAAGISYTFGSWHGVDGAWDDVEVRLGDVPLPTLIRRTEPPDVAREWPPPLSRPHRCGARSLAAVHLAVPDVDAAVHALMTLLGSDASPRTVGGRVHVPLASGELVVLEGEADRIDGVVLEVDSLEATGRVLSLRSPDNGVAWLDCEPHGLRLGFTER